MSGFLRALRYGLRQGYAGGRRGQPLGETINGIVNDYPDLTPAQREEARKAAAGLLRELDRLRPSP